MSLKEFIRIMEQKNSIINKAEFAMIQNLVTCSICCEIIKDPVQCTSCENCFCKICIEDWNEKSKKCPFKCDKLEMKPSRTIRVLLSQIKFKCPNDCGQEILYDDYDKHCNEICSKIDFKVKYQNLLKEFNAMKLEVIGTNNDQEKSFISYKHSSHPHPLFFNYVNRNGWLCNVCKSHNFPNKSGSYYCIQCDFDLCENCKLSDFKNIHHVHPLVFNYVNRINWKCEVCKASFPKNLSGSYYCKLCNYDLCKDCYKKTQRVE